MAIAMIPQSDKVTLITMDGEISEKELAEALEYAKKGCLDIQELQKNALRDFLKGDKNE